MRRSSSKTAAFALSAVMLAAGISCSSNDKKSDSTAKTSSDAVPASSVQQGEAGGTMQESFSTTATVTALDPATRQITLTTDDGTEASMTAGPEIRNFDQIHVGDKVNATITETLLVFVRSDGAAPSVSHAASLSKAPKGAKPGALASESYEIVASVKAIDPSARTATLLFSDGQTKTFPVRPDVDLSRYKVGDSVVIRITDTISVLVAKP
jgi:Cu/Ag efflux protein CusF